MLLQIAHRPFERGREINVVLIGEHDDGPEAVRELVGKRVIEIGTRTDTRLSLDQLRKVAYIANKAERNFFRAPLPPVAVWFPTRRTNVVRPALVLAFDRSSESLPRSGFRGMLRCLGSAMPMPGAASSGRARRPPTPGRTVTRPPILLAPRWPE